MTFPAHPFHERRFAVVVVVHFRLLRSALLARLSGYLAPVSVNVRVASGVRLPSLLWRRCVGSPELSYHPRVTRETIRVWHFPNQSDRILTALYAQFH